MIGTLSLDMNVESDSTPITNTSRSKFRGKLLKKRYVGKVI